MPVKMFVRDDDESAAAFEDRINAWIAAQEGRIASVSIAAAPWQNPYHGGTEFMLYACVHYEARLF
jgi:hypothetical protein